MPGSARPPLLVLEASDAQRAILSANAPIVAQLLRVSGLEFTPEAPKGAISFVVAGATFALPVAEHIDLTAELARLKKEIAAHSGDIEKISKKLGNADFISRAPEEVVEENRERLAEAEAAKAKLSTALKLLESVA